MASIYSALQSFGYKLTLIIYNPWIMISLFYIVALWGIFALFRGLLKAVFNSSEGEHTRKEINVISFMLAFMGVSGLFFLFRMQPWQSVILFGGTAGLLIVIVFAIILNKFFLNLANSGKEDHENDTIGKAIFNFWFIFGLLVSTSLVLSYLNFFLEQVTTYRGFLVNIKEIIEMIYPWLVILTLIFGIGYFVNKFKGREDEEETMVSQFDPKIARAQKILKRIKSRTSAVESLLNKIKKTIGGL